MADRKLDTEFVFEGDEIGGVPSNIDKKRPRPGTLSLACDRCRKRHKKCDGDHPTCGRCSDLGLECIYVADKRKRGSKPAPFAVAATTRKTESVPDSTTSNFFAEMRLMEAAMFLEYVRVYGDHIDFDNSAVAPVRDFRKFKSLDDPRQLALMGGVLGLGASICGNPKFAQTSFSFARNKLRNLYDESSALVAATHCLFGHYYLLTAQIDKAMYSGSLALKMLELLQRKNPHDRFIDGVQCSSLYAKSLIGKMDANPSTLTDIRRIGENILRLNVPDDSRIGLKMLFDIVIPASEALQLPADHLLENFYTLMSTVTRVPEYSQPKTALANRLFVAKVRIVAMMNLKVGNAREAIEGAETVLKWVERLGTHYHDMFAANALHCAGHVFIRLGCQELADKVMQLLEGMALAAQIAKAVMIRLIRLKEVVTKYQSSPEIIRQIFIPAGWTWELLEPELDPLFAESQSIAHDRLGIMTHLADRQVMLGPVRLYEPPLQQQVTQFAQLPSLFKHTQSASSYETTANAQPCLVADQDSTAILPDAISCSSSASPFSVDEFSLPTNNPLLPPMSTPIGADFMYYSHPSPPIEYIDF